MAVPQKLRCQVTDITDHGEGVYTVDLRPERPAPRFRPGQFLHMALDPYDPSGFWPESRVFSIASSPSQRDLLRISYSVKGRFTTRMAQELRTGGDVWIKLPYGNFVIRSDRDVVLFAGGTGITAFTAFLDGLTSTFPYTVTLFYGVRFHELLLYKEMIAARQATLKQLNAYYFVESGVEAVGSLPGRLSAKIALQYIAAPTQASYFLSGPPAMLRFLNDQLQALGISRQSIHIDAWE